MPATCLGKMVPSLKEHGAPWLTNLGHLPQNAIWNIYFAPHCEKYLHNSRPTSSGLFKSSKETDWVTECPKNGSTGPSRQVHM